MVYGNIERFIISTAMQCDNAYGVIYFVDSDNANDVAGKYIFVRLGVAKSITFDNRYTFAYITSLIESFNDGLDRPNNMYIHEKSLINV